MFNDKILKSVAEAVKSVMQQEALKGQQHQIDKNKNNKIDAHDFAILRGEKKPMKKEETNNPFDWRNTKSRLPTKPGDKAGFDSKKISTGTVYTRRPVKDEKPLKEEDAYSKDRYAVKDGKAVKDNPKHMGSDNYKDQPHHVWASSAEEAMKKKSVKESVTQTEYNTEIEKAKKKAGGEGNPDLTKGNVTAVKQESVEQIDERQMTEPEMKKREKIVKSMKKGMQGFKDRYGDRAKNVMYATATKQAMKD